MNIIDARELLKAMGQQIATYGFSPKLDTGNANGPQCFLGAQWAVEHKLLHASGRITYCHIQDEVMEHLRPFVGGSFAESNLTDWDAPRAVAAITCAIAELPAEQTTEPTWNRSPVSA